MKSLAEIRVESKNMRTHKVALVAVFVLGVYHNQGFWLIKSYSLPAEYAEKARKKTKSIKNTFV